MLNSKRGREGGKARRESEEDGRKRGKRARGRSNERSVASTIAVYRKARALLDRYTMFREKK